MFFFEKKNQKTFGPWLALLTAALRAAYDTQPVTREECNAASGDEA
jgi:hypothetical protein